MLKINQRGWLFADMHNRKKIKQTKNKIKQNKKKSV